MIPGETVPWRPLRIEWNDCPAEIRAAAEPHVTACLFALPSWVTELNLFWRESGETESGDAALSVTVRDEYRFLSVFIHPGFLAYDGPGRYRVVLHEFAHALSSPLVALVDKLLEHVAEDVKTFAAEDQRRAKEAVTQDIVEAMNRVRPHA